MKTLLVGYRAGDLFERGRHGKRATAGWLAGDVTCHVLDIYDRHAIEKAHHLKAICSPHLPNGPWDLIKFRTGPKLMSGELALSLLQEIHIMKPARFELDYVGRERDKNDLLAKIRDDPELLDEGGLALAEVASRDLKERGVGGRLLDMGCGCGLVGFLVAKAAQGISLVMVDSHSRAVEAANINAANLGIPAEVILSDVGTPARMDGTFDVFVGNPPYYSDYRIADVFLETARRALRPGGVCYTVCKNAAGLEPVQRRYFPDVEVTRRRGYAVLKSIVQPCRSVDGRADVQKM